MKLPCFIERYVRYTKAMYIYYYRMLITCDNYYDFIFIALRNMIVNLHKKKKQATLTIFLSRGFSASS